ncbi:MAG: heme biosynthesis HemY N-terminal domain-containing protein [Pseudomonadota bacterium]|nr:heme biosynthesis HemY N-terminal domain-containing protein [Pseudomonadota bacterium]
MFFKLFALVLLVLLGALLASWLGAQPGMMQLEWLGWQIEMRTSLAVAIIAIAALALLLLDRFLRGLLDLPSWLGRNLARRRTESGHRALTLGLMAVSAGEPDEAQRQAARAQRLLAAPRLTDLLSAQAAHLSGDHAAAGRYFTSLTRDPDTAFLGHIGLARLALEGDQPDRALASARQALGLRPKSALAARQVMILEAERGNWAAALPAQLVAATNADDADARRMAARQRAALIYLDVLSDLDLEADQKSLREAARQLESALSAWPEFWPAAMTLADILDAGGQPRKITKALETAFRAMPHEDIASRLGAAWATSEGSYVAKLIRLIPKEGEIADEGRRIVASAALGHGLVGEARRLLEDIEPAHRDAEAWRLLSRLAAAAEDGASETDALRHAGEAPRSRRWQCTNCRLVHDEWQSHCAGCASFATLKWQRPDGVTPLHTGTSPQLAKAD